MQASGAGPLDALRGASRYPTSTRCAGEVAVGAGLHPLERQPLEQMLTGSVTAEPSWHS